MNRTSDDYEYVDLPIFCGPLIKRETGKGIQSIYFNLTFSDHSNSNGNKINHPTFALVFQNYYTAMVSISLIGNDANNTNANNNEEIVILESKQLMESAFCEKGANDWYYIEMSECNSKYIDKHSLRIHLYQPSSMWNNCEIRNIKAVGRILKPRCINNNGMVTNKLSILNNKNAEDAFSSILKNNMKSIQQYSAKRESLKIK